jgi:outer membrane protein assembly factor BamB
MKILGTEMVGLVICLCAAVAAQEPTHDPIEGKWAGTAGLPQDRIHVAFEFKIDEQQRIHAFLFNPVSNQYRLDLGPITRSGDTYRSDGQLSLTWKNRKLEGSMDFGAPIELERTGKLPSDSLLPSIPAGPGPQWRTKLNGAIYAPAAIREGVAYVGTTGGMFYAISVSDGSFVWNFSAGRPIHGEALITTDAVFFACDNGFLYRLDRATGKEVWRYDLGDSQASRTLPHLVDYYDPHSGEFDWDWTAPKPLLADGVLYLGSGNGTFHAVSADHGTRVWQFESKGKIRTDAVIAGDHIVFANFNGSIFALDRTSGVVVWERKTPAPFTSSPALIAGKIVIGSRGGVLLAINPENGQTIWRLGFWGSSIESVPVLDNGSRFFIGSSDMRKVSLIDSGDGSVVWRTDVYGWAWARPAVAGTRLFASAVGASPIPIRQLGSLSALDRKTGKILWRWPMPEWPGSLLNGFASSPAVEGDSLVVGGLDGALYRFPVQ